MRRVLTGWPLAVWIAFWLTVAVLAGCTPHEVALFKSLDPSGQRAVLDELARRERPTDCVGAMRAVWPASQWSWAESIMWRESQYQPGAYNPSGASGCWQMMIPLHSWRFSAVGCVDPFNAWCNNLAALHLFNAAGRSPWAL